MAKADRIVRYFPSLYRPAERATLSVRAVSDLERGLKTRPHRDTVQLLANALKLPPEDRLRLKAAVPRRQLGGTLGTRFTIG